jgi:hypothetical protein
MYDLLSYVDHRIKYFHSLQFSLDFSISQQLLEVVPSKIDITLPIKRYRSQCWHYLVIYKQPFAMVTQIDRMKETVQSI